MITKRVTLLFRNSLWQLVLGGETLAACGGAALLLFSTAAIPQAALAQTSGAPSASHIGLPINGAFVAGTVDSVQLNNGNLHIDIPLLDLAGGVGIPLRFHFVYDTKVWNYAISQDPYSYSVSMDGPSSRLSYPGAVRVASSSHTENAFCNGVYRTQTYLDTLAFVDEDGTSHPFSVRNSPMTGSECGAAAPLRLFALDASGVIGDRAQDSSVLSDALLKNGTKYTFPTTSSGGVVVTDSNGNQITNETSYDSQTNTHTTTVRGTGGKQVDVSTKSLPNNLIEDDISYTDQNGQKQHITISYTYIATDAQSICFGGCTNPATGIEMVPQDIVLQDRVSSYHFDFTPNGLGDLHSLKLPTGAVLSYEYGSPDVSGDKVISRTIANNGQTAVTKFQYTFGNQSENTSNTIIVTDPYQNDTRYTCTVYAPKPEGLPGGAQLPPCFMTKQEIFEGPSSGQPFFIKTTNYKITGVVLPQSTLVSWPATREIAETDSEWDSIPSSGYYTGSDNVNFDVSAGNLVSQSTYDFGQDVHGPLLLKKGWHYLHDSDTSYASVNIKDRVDQEAIYDGSLNVAAQTTTTYDHFEQSASSGQSGLLTTSGTVNHDYGQFGSSMVRRGLPTSIARLGLNQSTYLNYNDVGSVTVSTDARGHSTKITYGAQNAYVHTIKRPTTSGVMHITTRNYDLDTGLLISEMDESGNTASYTYDTRLRLLSVSNPDGGSTTYTYPDPNHATVTLPLQQATTYTLDGLGRRVQTTSPDGAVSETHYDLLGRVSSITNLSFGSSDPSSGATSFSYDALGRPLLKCGPNNGTPQDQCSAGAEYSEDSYVGSSIHHKDEIGQTWSIAKDAAGRLISVQEPGGALTTYTYTALGDLHTVVQNGLSGETPRSRSFNYDTLSRLITAYSPESGWTCYGTVPDGNAVSPGTCTPGYDANGNLLVKTTMQLDNDGNSMAVHYDYDELDRVIHKWANDGDNLDAFRGYDDGPNGIGRLTSESRNGVAGESYGYDVMGRITSTRYHDYARDYGNAAKSENGMQVTYDLAGNPLRLVYPDGRSLTQTWDGSGRLETIKDDQSGKTFFDKSDATPPSGVLNAQYWPSGTLANAKLGDVMNESFALNNRLQPLAVYAGSSQMAGPAVQNLINRQMSYVPSGSTLCPSQASANNGNIYAIVDNLQALRTQVYSYDGLNRIHCATNSAGSFYHLYEPDSFGNTKIHDQIGPDMGDSFVPPNGGAPTNRLYHHGVDFTYNDAGQLTMFPAASGNSLFQLSYTGEGYLRCINGCSLGSYVYDAVGQRTFAAHGSTWNSYAYWNGNVMADYDNNGTFTDYIYANGQKIAQVRSQKPTLHLHGVRDSSVQMNYGAEGYVSGIPSSTFGYVVQAGDRLTMNFMQTLPTGGGLALLFNGNSVGTGDLTDTITGTPLYFNQVSDGAWHVLTGDLSPYAGLAISNVLVGIHNTAPAGTYDMYIADAAILTAGGQVLPLLTGQAASVPAMTGNQGGAYNLTSTTDMTPTADPRVAATYFLSDHLGTTQVTVSGNGWPTWQGEYTPFGQEVGLPDALGPLPDDGSPTRYKFTGKERDAESGLDYFGARYYSSVIGRFSSPDAGGDVFALPFADLQNPQTLNLYSYVGNNPLSNVDADGHDYHICVDNGNGGQNCFNLTDDQYKRLFSQQNGQQGINLPAAKFGSGGTITCGGTACGTTSYFEPGIQDASGPLLAIAAGAAAGPGLVRNMFNAFTSFAGSGNPITTNAVNTGDRASRLKELFGTEGPGGLQGNPEQAARQALQRLQATKQLPDGLSKADLDFYKGVLNKAENSTNPNVGVQSIRKEIVNLAQRILGGK